MLVAEQKGTCASLTYPSESVKIISYLCFLFLTMQPIIQIPDQTIQKYVCRILVFEERKTEGKTILPFFADGYPGIIFQITTSGLFVSPQNKLLPVFFLYGQTIHPIELTIEGPFKMITFQLYPDAVRWLLDIQPKDITDGCYDLSLLSHYKINPIVPPLEKVDDTDVQIQMITDFLTGLAKTKTTSAENRIQQAIHLILKSRGAATIKDIRTSLFITERTFERQFTNHVGISPKQFAKIIRFQQSLEEVTDQDLDKLTDIVYKNGFCDQSHFIRIFKEFTGQTPREFRNNQP
jgi:AraC-like DNA-binding protein